MSLQFKTPRIEAEYHECAVHNPRLKRLIDLTAEYVSLSFGKDLTITDLLRTPEESAALYASTPEGSRPKNRPHENWQAIDLRSSVFTSHEITQMLTFLNTLKFYGGQRPVAIYHTIAGNVFHFHIQFGNDT